MMFLLIGAVVAIAVIASVSLGVALRAIRFAQDANRESHQSHEHMDAHMRALDVLTDPDLDPINDWPPSGKRRSLRLISFPATPGAIGWVRQHARAHPVTAASIVTIVAAASYVALIWPLQASEPPMTMQQHPAAPHVERTTTVDEPSSSTIPPEVEAASAAGDPSASDAPPASASVSLADDSTTSAHSSASGSGPASASGHPSIASASTTTPRTSSSTSTTSSSCTIEAQTDLIKPPCVIVK